MTEHEPGQRLVVSIAELRELRRSERAPEALQQLVSERLARRAWRPEPRSLALGALAAAIVFALLPQRRSAAPSGPELALGPEPVAGGLAPGGAARVPAAPPPNASAAQQAPGRTEPVQESARESSAARLAKAFAKQFAVKPPEPSTLGNPAPELQPGLLRGLPARSFLLPGFSASAQADPQQMPLPAASGPNLVTNGDFSQGTALWSVRQWDGLVGPASAALARFEVVQGALCTTIANGEFVLGGWPWEDRSLSPHSFELERGQRYRLSLRAWSKGPLPVALVIKVGQQRQPYSPAIVARVPVTQLTQFFSVAFEPHADDDDAGIAFAASAIATPEALGDSSDLCIDDVRLTREARQL